MVTELFCDSHSRLGLSSLLSGTGFAFAASLIEEEGFHTLSMSEDIEFSVQQNLKGICVDYLEDAVYYDEQPISLKVMFRQLRRWTTGDYQITAHYAGKLGKKFCRKPSFMIWDSLLTLLLCGNMGLLLVLGLGYGCIGMINGGFQMIYALGVGVVMNAVTLLLAWTAVKRSSLSARKMLDGILLFPIYGMFFSFISICSFFCPQTKWQKIEHYGMEFEGKVMKGAKKK